MIKCDEIKRWFLKLFGICKHEYVQTGETRIGMNYYPKLVDCICIHCGDRTKRLNKYKLCTTCRREILSSATICPHCHESTD